MNKLTIPAILAATVLVAGMFAFMPVQQASTVHTTVQNSQMQLSSVASASTAMDEEAGTGTDTFTFTLDPDEAFYVLDIYADIAVDAADQGTDAGDQIGIDIEVNDVEVFSDVDLVDDNLSAGGETSYDVYLKDITGFEDGFGATDKVDYAILISDAGTDDTILADAVVTFIVQAQGSATLGTVGTS